MQFDYTAPVGFEPTNAGVKVLYLEPLGEGAKTNRSRRTRTSNHLISCIIFPISQLYVKSKSVYLLIRTYSQFPNCGIDLPLVHTPIIAETRFELVSHGYEPCKEPLLYSAILGEVLPSPYFKGGRINGASKIQQMDG